MEEEYVRPDPEELLKLISGDVKDKRRGHLTIFFGYAPGVGKTYAMLYDAAMRKKDENADIVIGYVELHKRPDTEAMLEGFEVVPPVKRIHNELILIEPDVEGIIKRKPNIVLIDELAHTNAPGMKHTKRYQDIEQILKAGINVYTTLNVQHIESLKDVVYQITDISVRENIPDPVFLQADEVKLIDLPIDDLLKRLRDGKIYTHEMAAKAVNKFFRSGNLLALRQLALRQVALRIDQQIARYIRTHTEEGWQPAENVLVGISASPYAEQLVRAAYRLAVELDSDLTALHIETDQNSSEEEKKWIKNAFDLAEKLKIKKVAIPGTDYATSLSRYAQDHKITKIVIGKPSQRSRIRSVDSILSQTREIDVYIFAGGEEAQETRRLQTSDPLKEMIKKIKTINRVIRIR